MARWSQMHEWLWPRVPDTVSDAFVMAQYGRLRGMAPMLYAAIILMIGGAVAGSPESPVWIRYGIPVLVVTVAVWRMLVWMGRPYTVPSVAAARTMVMRAETISILTSVPCSIWCIYSWAAADPERAMYFPLFMAMGTLSTTFCLSTLRLAAVSHMVIGLGPIVMAMMLTGDQMTMAAAISMTVACGFLFALQRFQHEGLVELLVLQRQMITLSHTDPLTGLANRRALQERLEQLASAPGEHGRTSLLLLDLDGFKPVNDRHGHAAGDEVLRQVASRLAAAAGPDGIASRIGGDEFAVLVLPGAIRTPEMIGTALLAALVRPFEFEGLRLRVGASLGFADCASDEATLDEMLRVADRALYAAKAGRGAPGDAEPISSQRELRSA